uniref:Uncharacterized protein n=1 Tax=Ciona savignyi TaxID=51511 RepID=H2Y746_CIOSA
MARCATAVISAAPLPLPSYDNAKFTATSAPAHSSFTFSDMISL